MGEDEERVYKVDKEELLTNHLKSMGNQIMDIDLRLVKIEDEFYQRIGRPSLKPVQVKEPFGKPNIIIKLWLEPLNWPQRTDDKVFFGSEFKFRGIEIRDVLRKVTIIPFGSEGSVSVKQLEEHFDEVIGFFRKAKEAYLFQAAKARALKLGIISMDNPDKIGTCRDCEREDLPLKKHGLMEYLCGNCWLKRMY